MFTKTADPIVAPVTTQELADYLRLDDTSDPVLSGILIAATDAAIQFMGRNIINRSYYHRRWDWPVIGDIRERNLAAPDGYFMREISLPYGSVVSVGSVTIYGEAYTDFIARDDSVIIKTPSSLLPAKTNNDPAIEVSYTAGMGALAADIPQPIKQAVLSMAALMYDHRGACDTGDMLNQSGAKFMLNPYRKAQVII